MDVCEESYVSYRGMSLLIHEGYHSCYHYFSKKLYYLLRFKCLSRVSHNEGDSSFSKMKCSFFNVQFIVNSLSFFDFSISFFFHIYVT